MMEEWKPVVGYEGLYEVSNLGKIRNVNTNRQLSTYVSKRGYERVMLWKHNKGKKYMVHRIVAFSFVPNVSNKPQINHKDENKLNNRAENLEWCTQLENHNYGTIRERISKSLINNPGHSKGVLAIDEKGIVAMRFPSIREASRQLNISPSNISDRLRNRVKTKCCGFFWKFERNGGVIGNS